MQDEQPQTVPLVEEKDKLLPEDTREAGQEVEKEKTVSQLKPEEPKQLKESKEKLVVKKIQCKLRRRLKKPNNATYKNKIVMIDGEKVSMIPSGFEIMTRSGWKPIMMRADKIK